jgi:hypothetical protein
MGVTDREERSEFTIRYRSWTAFDKPEMNTVDGEAIGGRAAGGSSAISEAVDFCDWFRQGTPDSDDAVRWQRTFVNVDQRPQSSRVPRLNQLAYSDERESA